MGKKQTTMPSVHSIDNDGNRNIHLHFNEAKQIGDHEEVDQFERIDPMRLNKIEPQELIDTFQKLEYKVEEYSPLPSQQKANQNQCIGDSYQHRQLGSFLLDVTKSSMYFYDTYVFETTGATDPDEKECLHQCLLAEDNDCWTYELQDCVDECSLTNESYCDPREYCKNIKGINRVFECMDRVIDECGNQCVDPEKKKAKQLEHLRSKQPHLDMEKYRKEEMKTMKKVSDLLELSPFDHLEIPGNLRLGRKKHRFSLSGLFRSGLKSTDILDIFIVIGIMFVLFLIMIILILERLRSLEKLNTDQSKKR